MFRNLPDGRKWVPNKKPYPPAPEGYCQDDRNPWIYNPVLVACGYRFDKSEQLPCGLFERIIECDYYNKEVSVPICHKCEILFQPKKKKKKKSKEETHL